MRTLTFDFEDMPLLHSNGFACGLVNGSAEIAFGMQGFGDWGVEAVLLEGFKGRDRENVILPPASPLHTLIVYTLEHEWAMKVSDAVAEEIENIRNAEADDAADARREIRMGSIQ